MKNILIISFFHSSQNQVGAIRTQRFAQYLPKLGWKPYVLTKKSMVKNKNNLSQENQDTFYIPSFPLNKPFHLESLIWIPLMLVKAIKIIKKIPIEVVLISCPPFHQAMVGVLLKKLFGIKLVIDYRDAWGLNPYHNGLDWLHRFIHHVDDLMESYLLHKLDFLVVSHQSMKKRYLNKYKILENKIEVIYNGFDPEMIGSESSLFSEFTILHLGNFYAPSGTRDPDLFLTAIKHIIREEKISPSQLRVFFIGEKYHEIEKTICTKDLSSYVSYLNRIPHHNALEYLNKSHMLLLIENRDVMTTKIFEYLATGKPILCLIKKETDLEQMIRKFSHNSYILSTDSIDEIKKIILKCFWDYQSGKYNVAVNEDFKKNFNRFKQTSRLVDLINRTIIS